MRNKGMLLASEVLKIVIAVICIAFLIYLLFSLYYANARGQDKAQAEEVINRIKDVVVHLDSGESLSEDVTDVNPPGWTFFGFTGNEKKPNLCAGKSCICMCSTVSYDNVKILGLQIVKDRQLSECDKNGVCLPISDLVDFKDFKIKGPDSEGTSIRITKTSGGTSFSQI